MMTKGITKLITVLLTLALMLSMFVACGDEATVGPAGADGKDGANGADGANGKSAYELAVENGFEGTLDEWLISLVGAQGEKGDKGDKGEKGDSGENGAKGAEGDKGDAGAVGAQGETGRGIAGVDAASEKRDDGNTYMILTITYTDGTVDIIELITGLTAIADESTLSDALASGESVKLSNDVATTDEVVVNNGTFDGNGNTIDASNYTDNGSNYECGINVQSGIVQNVTIEGAFRGLGTGGSGKYEMTGDVYFKNVTVTGSTYGINIGIGNGYKLYVSDSTICDWNSYSGLGGAEFTNCTFTSEGNYYACQRTSENATFTYTNCNFEQNTYDNEDGAEPYYLDSYGNGVIVFENCYMDGVLITEENFAEFFQLDPDNNTSVQIDGVTIQAGA